MVIFIELLLLTSNWVMAVYVLPHSDAPKDNKNLTPFIPLISLYYLFIFRFLSPMLTLNSWPCLVFWPVFVLSPFMAFSLDKLKKEPLVLLGPGGNSNHVYITCRGESLSPLHPSATTKMLLPRWQNIWRSHFKIANVSRLWLLQITLLWT